MCKEYLAEVEKTENSVKIDWKMPKEEVRPVAIGFCGAKCIRYITMLIR
jgi:hypothetical protein